MPCRQRVEMIKILKIIQEGKCRWQFAVRKFSFAAIESKIQLFKSYCYPIYGCALWRHSYQSSIRKLLSVRVTHSNVFVTSQINKLESGICDERNWPYQCGVHKFDYSLMGYNSITQTVLLLQLSIAMHITSLHWWVSGRVCCIGIII